MEEFILYINTLKKIIDSYYDKEIVFYNDGEWYSREHCSYLTPQELSEWALELAKSNEEDFDGCCSCGCTCDDD